MNNGLQSAFTLQSLADHTEYGLTKREYIATAIAQGLAASPFPGTQHQPKNLAKEAVAIADALLEALEVPHG